MCVGDPATDSLDVQLRQSITRSASSRPDWSIRSSTTPRNDTSITFLRAILTFANADIVSCVKGQDRWFTIESSYRGQTLETRFHAKAEWQAAALNLIRLPESEAAR